MFIRWLICAISALASSPFCSLSFHRPLWIKLFKHISDVNNDSELIDPLKAALFSHQWGSVPTDLRDGYDVNRPGIMEAYLFVFTMNGVVWTCIAVSQRCIDGLVKTHQRLFLMALLNFFIVLRLLDRSTVGYYPIFINFVHISNQYVNQWIWTRFSNSLQDSYHNYRAQCKRWTLLNLRYAIIDTF